MWRYSTEYYDTYRHGGGNKYIDTVNVLAGKNKNEMKKSLKAMTKNEDWEVSEGFIDELAGLIVASPDPINGLICEFYWFFVINHRNPEDSFVFRERIINYVLPSISNNLQFHTTEIGFRSSYATHKEPKTLSQDEAL